MPAQRIRVLPADLADEEQRGHAAAAVLAAGRVDILVNNAATVEPLGPTAGIPAEDLRLAFEVNVVAPAALTAAVLPGMLDAGWGASSTCPARSSPTRPAWSAVTPTPPRRPRSRRTL